MIDRIELNKIQALGRIGVLPEEKSRAQPFEVDLAIETDLSVAGASDDLNDTINYGEVTELVAGIIRNESHQLLEKVATRIASEVLAIPLSLVFKLLSGRCVLLFQNSWDPGRIFTVRNRCDRSCRVPIPLE